MLYYWAKIYIKQIKAGENYDKLERTIVILIADLKIKGLEELKRIIKLRYYIKNFPVLLILESFFVV